MELTPRRQNILTGAIVLLVLVAAVSIGVKAAFGAYEGGYDIAGRFAAAGQGLLPGSDVKLNGVTVGEVASIDLVDEQAEIRLTIKDGQRIPAALVATVRAKTLFGEKFIDFGLDDVAAEAAAERSGPYLQPGDRIARTVGGFELEAVLTDLYPVLAEIDPDELYTVISTLAAAGKDLGPSINRTLVNGAVLGEELASNVDLTARFLEDLALLSDELGDRADDVVELARAGNDVLPVLNDGEDDVVAILQQAGRLSNDVADLLEANQPFVDASLGDGSRTVQLLFDKRDQVVPLVVGLSQYLESLSSIIRIDVGNGTLMAAVKGVLGGDLCGIVPCPKVGGAASTAASAPTPDVPRAVADLVPGLGRDPGRALFDFLGEVLG